MCPTVDFREEKAGDGKTFSASFYLKPTANALRVFAAMLTPEHVSEGTGGIHLLFVTCLFP